jgi:Sap, sulfolipid-1-addressing protein
VVKHPDRVTVASAVMSQSPATAGGAASSPDPDDARSPVLGEDRVRPKRGARSRPDWVMTMGQGISEILTYAVGVAISPVPIIAVTLMLFSQRARVNGLIFLLGWVVALVVVSGVAYAAADQANAATDSTTTDTIA